MPEESSLPTASSAIQFLIHQRFINTVSQASFGYLPLTVQQVYDLRDALPYR